MYVGQHCTPSQNETANRSYPRSLGLRTDESLLYLQCLGAPCAISGPEIAWRAQNVSRVSPD
eukprot:2035625-Rhodomonas_salina.5